MEKLRRLSWFERIRTDPSPEDDSLLQITRVLSAQLQVLFWYKQIVWGRFDKPGWGWMISKPVIFSRGVLAFPGPLPEAELMLPEYLKGKLLLDEWRLLIAMHLLRFKAYNSGRMSKLLGKMLLALFGAFIPLLFLVPTIVGRAWGPLPVFLAWSPALLLFALWARGSLRKWEFELDRSLANRFGTESISQVLEKMKTLDPRATPSTRRARFLAYWSPSISERIDELKNPHLVGLPKPSRIPKIGLRGRATITIAGLAIFWGSGVVEGKLYAKGQNTVACATNTCAVLVVTSAVGYWLAILAGASVVAGVAQRVRQGRRKTIALV